MPAAQACIGESKRQFISVQGDDLGVFESYYRKQS